MKDLATLHHEAYERQYGEKLTDLLVDALILKHKKTGARICLMASDDENKTFCIGFRTPPENSTGVPHILEHSVLNGSAKYPVKEPFMELSKGSLQTYLNASTYPDKTVFPVASCNDKDFRNLVDVYMDSVLNPNIYRNEKIFRQEGWRYHLANADDSITINGVVYSEMKGSFSDPENLLYQKAKAALYPDTPYHYCSGGDPEVIPELSYEGFLDFHRRYYHPSNSFIFLYGNMDMYEYLDYLDREYLSRYDSRPVDSEIPLQKNLGILTDTYEYAVGEEEDEDNNDYLVLAVKTPADDPVWCSAWGAVTYALFDAPGAPVKQALIDAGIGTDVQSYTDIDSREPMFVLYAKGADAARKEEFYEIVEREAARIADTGINRTTLLGYLVSSEFSVRESVVGGTQRGLGLGSAVLGSFLYNEDDAFRFCHPIQVLQKVKGLLDTDYFEKVIREGLLSHKHELRLVGKPSRTIGAAQEQALTEKLKAYKESLSKEEIEKLVADTEALRVYQETPDTPEALATIPLLQISDIHPDARFYPLQKKEAGGCPVLHYNTDTNGIVYLRMIIDVTDLPAEELPYLGLFCSVLLRMDTKKHAYTALNDELRLHLGDLWSSVDTFSDGEHYRQFTGTLNHYFKVLPEELEAAFAYLNEMITEMDFSDKKRLREVLQEDRSGGRSGMISRGNAVAKRICLASFQPQEYFEMQNSGIGQYEFLVDATDHFDERADEIIRHLQGILAYTLEKKRVTWSVACDTENYKKTEELLNGFFDGITVPAFEYVPAPAEKLPWDGGYPLSGKCEAVTFGGRVNYVAQGGNYKAYGYPSGGHLLVLSRILSREYLYQNIRVKGGAYGAAGAFTMHNGLFAATTYRDPNLRRSYEVFKGIPEFVRTLSLGERELTKYIIGTISGIDRPLSVRDKSDVAVNDYYTGMTKEKLQKRWDEVLHTDEETLRKQADMLEAVLSDNRIACFGSESNVKQEAELFDSVRGLK